MASYLQIAWERSEMLWVVAWFYKRLILGASLVHLVRDTSLSTLLVRPHPSGHEGVKSLTLL